MKKEPKVITINLSLSKKQCRELRRVKRWEDASRETVIELGLRKD